MSTHLRRGHRLDLGDKVLTPADSLNATEVKKAHALGIPLVDQDGNKVEADSGGDE